MIRNSETSAEAAAVPAASIECDDGPFQVGQCDGAADWALSLMPPEPIVPDEITGLSRTRHLPKLVRQ